jgi:hypothetical protein
MKTPKKLIIVAAALAMAFPLAAQKDKDAIIESAWAQAPVQVDGSNADWAPESLALWKEFNISYGFKNDANFLYVVAVFNDPKFMSSLDQTGMFFWINPEGKDKKTYGLHLYQKLVTADQLIAELEKSGTALPEEKKAEVRQKPAYRMFACDPVNKKAQPIPNAVQQSGTYRYAKTKANVVFEAVIPLALLNDPAAATALDPAKPFKFGIEWGGMTEEMKKNRAAQIGDQNAQARAGDTSLSGQVGSEREGGGDMAPGASLSGLRRGPKQYSFWVNLKVSAQK